MNTSDIFNAFKRNTTLEYLLENTYIFAWESDIFGISKSGYINEIEVKTSRSDFQADFNKIKKHQILKCAFDKKKIALFRNNLHYRANRKVMDWNRDLGKREWTGKYSQIREVVTRDLKPDKEDCNVQLLHSSLRFVKIFCPHRFYYACPHSMIQKEEVPEYAGLYWINEKGGLIMKKQAPILHKFKYDLTKILLHKFYHESLNLRHKLSEMKMHFKHIEQNYMKGDLVDIVEDFKMNVKKDLIDNG